MFSKDEKQKIARAIESVIKEINHPEMDSSNIRFNLHVVGKESWSWADIRDNKSAGENPKTSAWNENARDAIRVKNIMEARDS